MATFYPTQIQTWLQCPRKYAHGRDRDLRAKYAKATPYFVLGNAAHDALQAFFDVTRVKPAERTVPKLHELFRDAWAGRGPFARNRYKQRDAREQAFGGDTATEKAWGEKGLDMLWRYARTADLAAQPLTAEQFHEIWLTEHVTLAGKIDRIDRRGANELEVFDYKTGKPPRTPRPAGEEPPKAPAADDVVRRSARPLGQDDLQLAAYALVVSRKFRSRVVRCTYVYLNDDLDLFFEPTDDDLRAKEEEIVALCGRILADRDHPPTPNALCGWCEYLPICPEGAEAVKARADAGPPPEDVPF